MGQGFQRRGQVTLEYISVAVLTIVGIIFMGGYVHRSINAYFHDADQQVQDSFEEKFEDQAPEDTGLNLPGCVCTPLPSPIRMCGGACPATQLYEQFQTCSTMHCAGLQGEFRCVAETASATKTAWNDCFIAAGGGDNYPKGVDNGTALHFAPEGAYASWNNCGKFSCCTIPQWKGICGAPGSSYEGYGLYDRYCGGSEFTNWQPFWINDPANCLNNCSSSINAASAQWCDPVNYNVNLPVANQLVRYVDDCSEGASLGSPYDQNKCLARCLGTPLLASSDHTSCLCPGGGELIAGRCVPFINLVADRDCGPWCGGIVWTLNGPTYINDYKAVRMSGRCYRTGEKQSQCTYWLQGSIVFADPVAQGQSTLTWSFSDSVLQAIDHDCLSVPHRVNHAWSVVFSYNIATNRISWNAAGSSAWPYAATGVHNVTSGPLEFTDNRSGEDNGFIHQTVRFEMIPGANVYQVNFYAFYSGMSEEDGCEFSSMGGYNTVGYAPPETDFYSTVASSQAYDLMNP